MRGACFIGFKTHTRDVFIGVLIGCEAHKLLIGFFKNFLLLIGCH